MRRGVERLCAGGKGRDEARGPQGVSAGAGEHRVHIFAWGVGKRGSGKRRAAKSSLGHTRYFLHSKAMTLSPLIFSPILHTFTARTLPMTSKVDPTTPVSIPLEDIEHTSSEPVIAAQPSSGLQTEKSEPREGVFDGIDLMVVPDG